MRIVAPRPAGYKRWLMDRMAELTRAGGAFDSLDAFTDPVVLPIDGALCIANMQVVARALSQAAGMSPFRQAYRMVAEGLD